MNKGRRGIGKRKRGKLYVGNGHGRGGTEFVPFFIAPISLRRQLDDGVQRNLDIREVGLREVVEVRVTFVDRVDSESAFRVYTGKMR